jgi:hypothetical protein
MLIAMILSLQTIFLTTLLTTLLCTTIATPLSARSSVIQNLKINETKEQ